jgi:co-chaperonin GroES (HSP10)
MSDNTLNEAFPVADPGIKPLGSRILVQIRNPKEKTASGIIIDRGSKDTEKWNTQVAKVIAVGPLAFHNRNTMEPWPEGAWCKEGDFVRVAKYGGDRWEVELPSGDVALYVIFNDLDIIGLVTGDPTKIRAFI